MSKPRISRITLSILLSAGALLAPLPSFAAEGGSGVYALGFLGPQAGMVPPAGSYVTYNYYSYEGSAKANFSAGRPGHVPGTEWSLTGSSKTELDLAAHVVMATQIFESSLLGGRPGIAIAIPYADADLTVSGSGTIGFTRDGIAFDPVRQLSFNGKASRDDQGLGDITMTGLIGWHNGNWHSSALLNVYAPTGDYDVDNIVNVGRNHWAVEPMGNLTYLNPENGIELSLAAGVTFNQENDDTNYTTGDEFHIDLAALQHFSENFYLGVGGYYYKQLTGDSGDGAIGDFKGEVRAIGPVIGGTIPLGGKHKLYVNARYLNESGAEKRLEGDSLWLTATLPM